MAYGLVSCPATLSMLRSHCFCVVERQRRQWPRTRAVHRWRSHVTTRWRHYAHWWRQCITQVAQSSSSRRKCLAWRQWKHCKCKKFTLAIYALIGCFWCAHTMHSDLMPLMRSCSTLLLDFTDLVVQYIMSCLHLSDCRCNVLAYVVTWFAMLINVQCHLKPGWTRNWR